MPGFVLTSHQAEAYLCASIHEEDRSWECAAVHPPNVLIVWATR